MMRYLVAAPVLLFLVMVLIALWRVRPRGQCCAPADPARDLRMRDALAQTPPRNPAPTEDDGEPAPGDRPRPPSGGPARK